MGSHRDLIPVVIGEESESGEGRAPPNGGRVVLPAALDTRILSRSMLSQTRCMLEE